MNKQKEKILIIKFGALGDFILCTGPFSAIRKYHPQAEITLLTTKPFEHLAKKAPWFDHIEIDLKPSALQLSNWLKMRKFIIGNKWSRIYDFQHNDRTDIYFRFLPKPKIEWSGITPGCSHPHLNPNRNNLHTIERQAEQLDIAGINQTPKTDIDWLKDDISIFEIKKPFALLVPGGAEHRKNKRWPKENYASLAKYLNSVNITPVLIGGSPEENILREIESQENYVINLCNLSSFGHIASLARMAIISIGNDTGPMHIIASAGCPSLVLFSEESNPDQTAPRGEKIAILKKNNLSDLDLVTVVSEVKNLL